MVTCGLKLTHDGAISLIDNNKLLFSIEMEKINNNPRFTEILHTKVIGEVLASENCKISDIDLFVVDGWGGYDHDSLAIQPRLKIEENYNFLQIDSPYGLQEIAIAQYRERSIKSNIFEKFEFHGLPLFEKALHYQSYHHVAGHIMSAYATSPFAARRESSYILIWDGGMFPRLYYFDAQKNEVENLGPLFLIIGNIYSIFSQHFGPFKVNQGFAKDSLSVAGKVMAYIALGELRSDLFAHFEAVYNENYTTPMGFANVFANEFKRRIAHNDYKDEDILYTFHVYLENLLVEKLKKKISRYPKATNNFCYAGGCALNIKWNSAIRNSGIFNEIYIPPFPNDSGSAIGMAALGSYSESGEAALDWSVFSGPKVIANSYTEDWSKSECSIEQLAKIIYENDEPIIFLDGRAELGPRALGNRSIIASATSMKMKDILNDIKNREGYRPVAPICIEEEAASIFIPGCADPYMLYDHEVKSEWQSKIPAVCHLDGTARLQTVAKSEDRMISRLLQSYFEISGIPVLCNTSANLKGCGFFPDIESVMKSDIVNYIWHDNMLYEKSKSARVSPEELAY